MDVVDALREFIRHDLHWDGDPALLTPDFPLIENHVVDSLGLFMLVGFVENRLGVSISDEELVPENFGTIGAIARIVAAKRQAAELPG